ncbi:MAG: protein kinase, partial [Ktedonobacteraceae bacterium]
MTLDGKQFSHYRLRHIIGSGGMSKVYLAEDIHIHRQVAVKVIEIETDPTNAEEIASTLRLFVREATAIAQLDDPHILPLYDYGEETLEGDRFAYLVTPYRSQGSLAGWLRKRAQAQRTQPLTLKQVAHLIQQAATGLQYAHDHQVIHQDVKPANFLVRGTVEAEEYPGLQLADFGIARLEHATSSMSQSVRGTPTYMAPELQVSMATAASDQYSLAIMAYELLTGKPPFQGTLLQLIYAHQYTNPQLPHEINPLLPSAVDPVLMRALAKQPDRRFSSVTAFAQDFNTAFQGVDEKTTLRMLAPLPATPSTPNSLPTGDIRATLVISVEEAQRGTMRSLTLPGGRKVTVQIPPGAQADQVFALIGQGETLGPGQAGTLYLTLSVLATQPQPSPGPRSRTKRPPKLPVFPLLRGKPQFRDHLFILGYSFLCFLMLLPLTLLSLSTGTFDYQPLPAVLIYTIIFFLVVFPAGPILAGVLLGLWRGALAMLVYAALFEIWAYLMAISSYNVFNDSVSMLRLPLVNFLFLPILPLTAWLVGWLYERRQRRGWLPSSLMILLGLFVMWDSLGLAALLGISILTHTNILVSPYISIEIFLLYFILPPVLITIPVLLLEKVIQAIVVTRQKRRLTQNQQGYQPNQYEHKSRQQPAVSIVSFIIVL